MQAKEAIKAEKFVTKPGEWKAITGKGGRMPRNAFKLRAGDPVEIGRNWRWRVDQLSDGVDAYRLLTAFERQSENFLGWLALEVDGQLTLVSRLEFHSTHPGWHCHAPCADDLGANDSGALRTRGVNRVPGGENYHRRDEFDADTETSALTKSFNFFKVVGAPDGALI